MTKRKQITFDIDTNVAKEILGERNYIRAYADIREFMENGGWQHIEGSVYMSVVPVTTTNVAHLVDDLIWKYPYLTKCIREMHQSDITNVHSLSHHFDYDGTPGPYARKAPERCKSTIKKHRAR